MNNEITNEIIANEATAVLLGYLRSAGIELLPLSDLSVPGAEATVRIYDPLTPETRKLSIERISSSLIRPAMKQLAFDLIVAAGESRQIRLLRLMPCRDGSDSALVSGKDYCFRFAIPGGLPIFGGFLAAL